MSSVKTIEETALAWSVKKMSGAMTPGEREALDEWLAADPRHATAFEENARLDEFLNDVAFAAAAEDGADELMRLSKARMAQTHAPRRQRPSADGRRPAHALALPLGSLGRRQAMAACAALFAIGAAVTLTVQPQPAPSVYATAIGEQRNVALDDGSAIALNTNSRIAVAYSKRERHVAMNGGEAIFDVERDTGRPFIIAAAQAEILVTGTRFAVKASAGGTTVSVFEGSVRVTPPATNAIMLSPGEELNVSASGAVSPVINFDAGRAAAWLEGKARYRETPLREALGDLNRYFSKPIVLSADVHANAPLTGEFNVADQDAVIAALSAAFSLTALDEPDRILLQPGG